MIRELLRRRPLLAGKQAWLPCGLSGAWDETVTHEVTAALGISVPAADKLIWLAWALQARIPRIGAALDAGLIDYVKGASLRLAPARAEPTQGSRAEAAECRRVRA